MITILLGNTIVLIPMTLFAGTFFPLDQLPALYGQDGQNLLREERIAIGQPEDGVHKLGSQWRSRRR